MLLEGRVAIVTSAAPDVGRALAERFAEEGAQVMLADATDDGAHGDEVERAESGTEIAHFEYKPRDKLYTANLLAATYDRFGRVDILVNAAQSLMATGPFLDLDAEAFDEAVGDNVAGVFQLSQAVAKRMIREAERTDNPSGVIVNLSSIAAVRTVPTLLTHSVASAALDQLTRSMAASLAPHGIRVNAVSLGGVLTDRLRSAFRDDADLREEMIEVTPLGRLADLAEAADAAVFLASDKASYITGQILSVDGGRTLRDPLASPVRS